MISDGFMEGRKWFLRPGLLAMEMYPVPLWHVKEVGLRPFTHGISGQTECRSQRRHWAQSVAPRRPQDKFDWVADLCATEGC